MRYTILLIWILTTTHAGPLADFEKSATQAPAPAEPKAESNPHSSCEHLFCWILTAILNSPSPEDTPPASTPYVPHTYATPIQPPPYDTLPYTPMALDTNRPHSKIQNVLHTESLAPWALRYGLSLGLDPDIHSLQHSLQMHYEFWAFYSDLSFFREWHSPSRMQTWRWSIPGLYWQAILSPQWEVELGFHINQLHGINSYAGNGFSTQVRWALTPRMQWTNRLLLESWNSQGGASPSLGLQSEWIYDPWKSQSWASPQIWLGYRPMWTKGQSLHPFLLGVQWELKSPVQ